MARKTPQAHLKSEGKDFTKSYITYDGLSRMEYCYTIDANGADGDACSVTQYVYVGSTNLVSKRREYEGTWVAATMDIP